MKRRRRRRQEEEGGDKTRQDTTLGGRSASQHVTSKTSAPEWPLQATSHGIQPLRARPSARAPTRPKARANALEGSGGTANKKLHKKSKQHKKSPGFGLGFRGGGGREGRRGAKNKGCLCIRLCKPIRRLLASQPTAPRASAWCSAACQPNYYCTTTAHQHPPTNLCGRKWREGGGQEKQNLRCC